MRIASYKCHAGVVEDVSLLVGHAEKRQDKWQSHFQKVLADLHARTEAIASQVEPRTQLRPCLLQAVKGLGIRVQAGLVVEGGIFLYPHAKLKPLIHPTQKPRSTPNVAL